MAAVDIAKKQAMLDSVLTTNISDQVAPALRMLSKYLTDSDYELINYGNVSISITGFEKGNDDLHTRVQTDLTGMQYLQENSEIQIVTIAPDATYNGYYRILNIDTVNYTFEIRKIFSVTKTATATLVRYSDLEYAHAYFILHMLVLSAQSVVEKKVLYTSNGFGEGTINMAGMTEKTQLADEYLKKAKSYIGYCHCESI